MQRIILLVMHYFPMLDQVSTKMVVKSSQYALSQSSQKSTINAVTIIYVA